MTKQAQRALSMAIRFFFYGLILGLAFLGFGACEPAEPPIYDPPPPTPEQAAAAAKGKSETCYPIDQIPCPDFRCHLPAGVVCRPDDRP